MDPNDFDAAFYHDGDKWVIRNVMLGGDWTISSLRHPDRDPTSAALSDAPVAVLADLPALPSCLPSDPASGQ